MKRFFPLLLLIPQLLFGQMKGDFHTRIYFEEYAGKFPNDSLDIKFILAGKNVTYYFSDRGYSVVQKNENGISNRTDFFFEENQINIPVGENEIVSTKKYYSNREINVVRQFEQIIYHNVIDLCDMEFSLNGDYIERKIIKHNANENSFIPGRISFDVRGSRVSVLPENDGYSFKPVIDVEKYLENRKIYDNLFFEEKVSPNDVYKVATAEYGRSFSENQSAYWVGVKSSANQSAATISSISWLTYIGGNSADEFFGITLTNDSGVIVVGRSGSFDFPSSVGSIQDTMAGNYDAVAARFDKNGNCLWSTYFGGTNFDGAYQVVAIDTSYVICGMTNSTDLPVRNATQNFNAGSYDAFLLEIDNSGSEIRSTYFGGSGGDQGIAIAKDTLNRIVLTGSSSSTDLPLASSGYQPNLGGQIDAFVAIFDFNLVALWSTYYGGTMSEDIHTVCVTPQGEICFAGGTRSNDFHVTPNAWQNGLLNQPDNYIVKFGMDGTLHYSTFFGGTNNEDANGIVSDETGNLYLTGFTYSTDFPIQGTSFQTNINGQNDVYVSKFDTAGQLVWSTYVGGAGQDVAWCMIGKGKYLFICGETASPDFPVSPNAIQNTYVANSDGFVIKMDTAGQMISGTFMGGSGYDALLALTVDADTNVIACGDTYSTNLAVTSNAFQMTNHFNGDGYVIKFGMAEELISTNVISENNNLFSVSVFPNPSNDVVNIVSDKKTISRIEVFDPEGRLIKSQSENSFAAKINVGDLESGIYLLKVCGENSEVGTFRVIRN